MLDELEIVVRALNDAGVRYVLVGGVAVLLHGYLRTTTDVDLVVHQRAARGGRPEGGGVPGPTTGG